MFRERRRWRDIGIEKKKTGAGLRLRLGCVRITEMKGMMSFLESKSYSLPTYV